MFRLSAKWDATVYTLTVAFGVPLVSWFVSSPLWRERIVLGFFALTTAWWILEIAEMIVPVVKRGVVDEVNATAQNKSIANFKNWAWQGAIVIWVVAEVGYIVWHVARDSDHLTILGTMRFIVDALFFSPVALSVVGWLVIVHTYIVGRASVYFFPLILFILSKAFPRGERIEEETVTVAHPPRYMA